MGLISSFRFEKGLIACSDVCVVLLHVLIVGSSGAAAFTVFNAVTGIVSRIDWKLHNISATSYFNDAIRSVLFASEFSRNCLAASETSAIMVTVGRKKKS
jgi:hypothetical protein